MMDLWREESVLNRTIAVVFVTISADNELINQLSTFEHNYGNVFHRKRGIKFFGIMIKELILEFYFVDLTF